MIKLTRRQTIGILLGLALAFTVNLAKAAEFSQQELAYMPATEQLELFKRGTITPVDVLKAQKAQYDAHEPRINAVTVAYWDDAMKQAEASSYTN